MLSWRIRRPIFLPNIAVNGGQPGVGQSKIRVELRWRAGKEEWIRPPHRRFAFRRPRRCFQRFKDEVVASVTGLSNFWMEANDSPSFPRKLDAAFPTEVSTASLRAP